MENSENKFLISTGSSNLAKSEELLLSTTKKILSEIKPQQESVRIGPGMANQKSYTFSIFLNFHSILQLIHTLLSPDFVDGKEDSFAV